jgi:hypothetical protein
VITSRIGCTFIGRGVCLWLSVCESGCILTLMAFGSTSRATASHDSVTGLRTTMKLYRIPLSVSEKGELRQWRDTLTQAKISLCSPGMSFLLTLAKLTAFHALQCWVFTLDPRKILHFMTEFQLDFNAHNSNSSGPTRVHPLCDRMAAACWGRQLCKGRSP